MKEWSVQHKDLFGCAAHARRSNIDKMESLQLVNATTKALYAVREKCFACLDGKHKLRVLEGPQKAISFRSNFGNIFCNKYRCPGAASTKKLQRWREHKHEFIFLLNAVAVRCEHNFASFCLRLIRDFGFLRLSLLSRGEISLFVLRFLLSSEQSCMASGELAKEMSRSISCFTVLRE